MNASYYLANTLTNSCYDFFNSWSDGWTATLQKNQSNSNSIKGGSNNSTKHVIVMIDDEEICLLSMELFLINTSYTLITANSGKKGLEYIKSNPNNIDLIFLDLMMPDIYGLDVLAEIKEDPILAKIPVILQTGTHNEREIEKAYKLGISSHIKKPYQKAVIISAIENSLKDT